MSAVASARRKLGLDHAGFARLIEQALGWHLLPETIAAWEDDVPPPGDLLAWCAVIAQAADNGPAAVVIPFPGPLPPPDWDLIDRVAAEMDLWFEPPKLRVVR